MSGQAISSTLYNSKFGARQEGKCGLQHVQTALENKPLVPSGVGLFPQRTCWPS
jgi:hypothetical protein